MPAIQERKSRRRAGRPARRVLVLVGTLALLLGVIGPSMPGLPFAARTPAASATTEASGTPVHATMYYTRWLTDADTSRVKAVTVDFDGTTMSVSNNRGISSTIAGADGLLFSNDSTHLLVGGQENKVYRVDTGNGSSTSASASPATKAFHLAADPDGQHFWSGGIPDGLAQYPLDLSAGGVGHPAITGDDFGVDTLAWADGKVFYTSSDPYGNGSFGEIDLTTFVTTRKISNLPAAHGMSFDPFSGDLILYGSNHITQIDPTNDAVVKSDLTVAGLNGNSFGTTDLHHLDQGAVDGKGHIYVAANDGTFVFVDYSADGLVADGIEQTAFLATYIDDVAPMSGPGSAPFTTDPGTSVPLGTAIQDSATVRGLNPGGTVDFRLYAANDPTCTGPAIFDSLARPVGTNSATSDTFTPTATGTYHWKAHYSGDKNFAPEDSNCADEPISVTTPGPPGSHPRIGLLKSGPDAAHVGDTVTYTFTVTNPGNVPLSSVSLSDPRCDRPPVQTGGDTNDDSVLQITETWTYSCPHRILASDPNPLPNTATVAGTNSNVTVTDSSSHILDIIHPAIQVTKSGPTTASEGDVVTYTFSVTNTGDVPLTNVTVTDDRLGSVGTIASLPAGATQVLTKNFTVPATGVVDNTGTACGTDPLALEVCATDHHHLIVTSVLGNTISQPDTLRTALPAVLPATATLPRTGANLSLQVVLGALAMGLGLLLARTRRRVAGTGR